MQGGEDHLAQRGAVSRPHDANPLGKLKGARSARARYHHDRVPHTHGKVAALAGLGRQLLQDRRGEADHFDLVERARGQRKQRPAHAIALGVSFLPDVAERHQGLGEVKRGRVVQPDALAEFRKADTFAPPRDLFQDGKGPAQRLHADALPGRAARQRVGVQSLGRAFAILEEVARRREGIGLADLSKRVGLHNSTTFHLAKTLVSLGYIRQERDTKRYRVGRPLFALAASALDEVEMVSLATPILEELSAKTGESSHFAVRMGDAIVVIARTSGPGAFQLAERVGVVRPAHCTALGKVILAALHPDQLERFLERVELEPSTENSITDKPTLLREVQEVRRNGIAFDDSEFNPEVRCVAVPVQDFTGQVVGALGISGPIWRLSTQALKSRAKVVQAAADRLSREFGASGPGSSRNRPRDPTHRASLGVDSRPHEGRHRS